jgi:hypothetical protein
VHQVLLQTGKNCHRNLSDVKKLAFGDETMSKTQTFDLFSKLKSGVTSVDHAKCLGHPLTGKMDESVAWIKEMSMKTDASQSVS